MSALVQSRYIAILRKSSDLASSLLALPTARIPLRVRGPCPVVPHRRCRHSDTGRYGVGKEESR
jgi:hypothetical protein